MLRTGCGAILSDEAGPPPAGSPISWPRLLGQRLTERWDQQIIIDNRPGANAKLGAEVVLRAPPVSADTTFVMNPHFDHSLKYDPLSDFEPISGLGYSPQALVVHPSAPVKNVAELIAYGNAHPGELNYGTFGIGSSGHSTSSCRE